MANVIVFVLFINNNIIITLTSSVNKIEYKNSSAQCIAKYPDQLDEYFSNEDKIFIQAMFISVILCILFYNIQLKVHLH